MPYTDFEVQLPKYVDFEKYRHESVVYKMLKLRLSSRIQVEELLNYISFDKSRFPLQAQILMSLMLLELLN